MSHDFEITLVVPVRNEAATIDSLWQTIVNQTRQPERIVFVDGGSSDRTIELIRSIARIDRRLLLIESGGAMPGEGRNIGIEAARTEWVALTDAGTSLDSCWLERLADEVLAAPSLDVVYGNYEPVIENLFDQCATLAYVPAKTSRQSARDLTPMRGPSTASMLLRRSVWKEVGGFPSWRAAEDLIFINRIESAGYRVGWAPRAKVCWQLRPDLYSTFSKFALYSKHNVWAGMERHWHYGVARQYLIGIILIFPIIFHSIWWVLLPVAGFLARTLRSINTRREEQGLAWTLNPSRVGLVALILLVIDLATFTGWIMALTTSPAATPDPLDPVDPVDLANSDRQGSSTPGAISR